MDGGGSRLKDKSEACFTLSRWEPPKSLHFVISTLFLNFHCHTKHFWRKKIQEEKKHDCLNLGVSKICNRSAHEYSNSGDSAIPFVQKHHCRRCKFARGVEYMLKNLQSCNDAPVFVFVSCILYLKFIARMTPFFLLLRISWFDAVGGWCLRMWRTAPKSYLHTHIPTILDSILAHVFVHVFVCVFEHVFAHVIVHVVTHVSMHVSTYVPHIHTKM